MAFVLGGVGCGGERAEMEGKPHSVEAVEVGDGRGEREVEGEGSRRRGAWLEWGGRRGCCAELERGAGGGPAGVVTRKFAGGDGGEVLDGRKAGKIGGGLPELEMEVELEVEMMAVRRSGGGGGGGLRTAASR